MSELSDDAKAFLDAHADEGLPTAAEVLRVRGATLAALSIRPDVTPVSAPLGAKVVAGITLAIVLGAAAAFTWLRHEPNPAPVAAPIVPATRPAPVVTVPPAEERPVVNAPTPPPRARVVDRPKVAEPPAPGPAPAPPPIEEPVDPSEEFALIAQAHASTRDGNPGWALELLAQHQRRFGDRGLLTEEAHAARVKALCALGRSVEARAEADALAQLTPSSVHLARVEHACW